MKLAAIKSITYNDAATPTETIEFESAAPSSRSFRTPADGKVQAAVVNGWNRVRNINMGDPAAVIQ